MPPRLSDDVRKAVLADIKAGKPRNGIAREHEVSPSTVTKIAREAGITDAFDRSQTIKSTRAREADTAAKQADQAAQRAALAQLMLDDARRLRDRAWSEYTLVVGSSQGADMVKLDLPPLNEVRQAYTAAGIAIDKHITLVKHDAGDGADHAKSLLLGLSDALGAAARALGDTDIEG